MVKNRWNVIEDWIFESYELINTYQRVARSP